MNTKMSVSALLVALLVATVAAELSLYEQIVPESVQAVLDEARSKYGDDYSASYPYILDTLEDTPDCDALVEKSKSIPQMLNTDSFGQWEEAMAKAFTDQQLADITLSNMACETIIFARSHKL